MAVLVWTEILWKASRTDGCEYRNAPLPNEPPAFPAHEWRAEGRREDDGGFHAQRARAGAGEKARLLAAESTREVERTDDTCVLVAFLARCARDAGAARGGLRVAERAGVAA